VTKMSGLPSSFTIDDSAGTPVTFSNQVATLGLDISQALQDSSGLDKTGTERIPLRGDWSAPITGAAMSPTDVIPVFGDVRGARDVLVTYPGGVTFTGVCVIASFSSSVNQDGSWDWNASVSSSDGTFPTLELGS
jgi:hypothetical protein